MITDKTGHKLLSTRIYRLFPLYDTYFRCGWNYVAMKSEKSKINSEHFVLELKIK
jgi:hypothetical protein